MLYNTDNWYWAVEGSVGHIWSSARLGYVATSDAAYATWLAAGNTPTVIPSTTDLVGVMQQQILLALRAAGLSVLSTAAPAFNGIYALDKSSQTDIAGIAAGKGLPGGGVTFSYATLSGTPIAFNAIEFSNFASAVEGYIYAFSQALVALIADASATLPSQPLTIP
jgi:hypothetical protein